MNKGNLNKLVTNYPIDLTEEEISNLSGTLAPVIAACGGGGGGTGGKIYTGIGFVNVNNTTNQIGLTNEANTKLNQDIPTKVSDLTDSASYQTVAGMDEYLTTGAAQDTYLSKSDAESNYAPIGTYTDVQTLKNQIQNVYTKSETSASNELSAEFDSLSAKYQEKGNYASQQSVQNLSQSVQNLTLNKQDKLTFGYDENNAISSINSTALAGQGGTTYSAGQYINIDSNDTISVTGVVAIDKTSAYDPILLGDANITAVSSRVNNRTTWNLSVNATPVVTDTKLTGDNCVTAHTTETSGEWAVGLVQSAYEAIDSVGGIATDVGTLKTASSNWNKVSDKLDTTAFSTVSGTFLTTIPDTYATKEYANNASANALSEAKTWVGLQGFYTKASGDNDYAPKSVTATVNTLTGASAGWNEVTAKLDASVASTTYQTKADMNDYLTKSEASTTYQPTGNYLVADDIKGKLDKSIYANASGNWEASYNVLTAYSAAGTWLTAHQSLTNYYTKSETSGAGELSTEFAKYVTSSNVTTQDTDYVMTTTGWKVLTLPGGGMTQVIHDDTLTGQGNADNSKLGLAQTAYNAITSVSSKLDTTAFSTVSGKFLTAHQSLDNYYTKTQVDSTFALSTQLNDYLTTAQYQTDSGTFLTKSSADNDYAPLSITATVNTLTAASAGWNNKVDKPTSLNDKYLVLRTDSNGAVSGWEDLKKECYSKTEATGTFVATANIDTTTLSGDGKTVSTKLGVKTDVIATKEYVNSSFLPLTGGTVSGLTTISGSDFDNTLEVKRSGQANNYAHIGLNNSRGLSFKAFDDNASNNVQFDILPNNSNSALVKVSHNDSQVGFLIPAITATTTAGLTNDGILHIILES